MHKHKKSIFTFKTLEKCLYFSLEKKLKTFRWYIFESLLPSPYHKFVCMCVYTHTDKNTFIYVCVSWFILQWMYIKCCKIIIGFDYSCCSYTNTYVNRLTQTTFYLIPLTSCVKVKNINILTDCMQYATVHYIFVYSQLKTMTLMWVVYKFQWNSSKHPVQVYNLKQVNIQ